MLALQISIRLHKILEKEKNPINAWKTWDLGN